MAIEWKLETVKTSKLKANPHNPRKMSKNAKKELEHSLNKFGVIDKIIVNTDYMIIGGHQRLSVLRGLGYREIDCYVPDRELTEKECSELLIRLNKNQGEWDWDILANEWDGNDLLTWGFTGDDLFSDAAPKPKTEKHTITIECYTDVDKQDLLQSAEFVENVLQYGRIKGKNGRSTD